MNTYLKIKYIKASKLKNSIKTVFGISYKDKQKILNGFHRLHGKEKVATNEVNQMD
jgi:hypothetical protein